MSTNNKIFMTEIDSSEVLKKDGVGVFKNIKPIKGYKKIMCQNGENKKEVIVDIEVPNNSIIVKPYGFYIDENSWEVLREDNNKLRTNTFTIKSYADSKSKCEQLYSMYNYTYKYNIGETYFEKVDENIEKEYSTGLHFFLDKQDAEFYE